MNFFAAVFSHTLVAALIGAVGGLIFYGLSSLFRQATGSGKQAGSYSVIGSVLCMALMNAIPKDVKNNMAEPVQRSILKAADVVNLTSKQDQFGRKFLDHLDDFPLVKEQVQAALKSRQPFDAKRLSNLGMRRMDDVALLARAQILKSFIDKMDASTCAALFKGTIDRERMAKVFEMVDDATMDEWVTLSLRAANAEITQAPIPPLNDTALHAALEELNRPLDSTQARLLNKVLAGQTTDDNSTAWAFHAVLDGIPG